MASQRPNLSWRIAWRNRTQGRALACTRVPWAVRRFTSRPNRVCPWKPREMLRFPAAQKKKALVGVEPTVADLQSAALASWLQRPETHNLRQHRKLQMAFKTAHGRLLPTARQHKAPNLMPSALSGKVISALRSPTLQQNRCCGGEFAARRVVPALGRPSPACNQACSRPHPAAAEPCRLLRQRATAESDGWPG
jgi:hypothetical protein